MSLCARYVDEAVGTADFSEVRRLLIVETARAKGHDDVSLFAGADPDPSTVGCCSSPKAGRPIRSVNPRLVAESVPGDTMRRVLTQECADGEEPSFTFQASGRHPSLVGRTTGGRA